MLLRSVMHDISSSSNFVCDVRPPPSSLLLLPHPTFVSKYPFGLAGRATPIPRTVRPEKERLLEILSRTSLFFSSVSNIAGCIPPRNVSTSLSSRMVVDPARILFAARKWTFVRCTSSVAMFQTPIVDINAHVSPFKRSRMGGSGFLLSSDQVRSRLHSMRARMVHLPSADPAFSEFSPKETGG